MKRSRDEALKALAHAETGFSKNVSTPRYSVLKVAGLIEAILKDDVNKFSPEFRSIYIRDPSLLTKPNPKTSLPSMLHFAVAVGNLEFVKILAQHVPRQSDDISYPALLVAAHLNDKKMVDFLLKDMKQDQLYAEHPISGLTAFEVAHQAGHYKLSQYLLDMMTPTYEMIKRAYLSNNIELLTVYFAIVDRDEFVRVAYDKKDKDVLRAHFDRFKTVDHKILKAIANNDIRYLSGLIESNSLIEPQYLAHAIKLRKNDAIAILMQAGCNPNFHLENGETPLTQVIKQNNARATQLLIPHADLAMKNKQGKTPHQCVKNDTKLSVENQVQLRVEHARAFLMELDKVYSDAIKIKAANDTKKKQGTVSSLSQNTGRFRRAMQQADRASDIAECSTHVSIALAAFESQLVSETNTKSKGLKIFTHQKQTPLLDALYRNDKVKNQLGIDTDKPQDNHSLQQDINSMLDKIAELGERTEQRSPRGVKRPAVDLEPKSPNVKQRTGKN